jgi:C4-dicarboxylate transporter DctQ subunit
MRGLGERITRWEGNFIALLMASMTIVSFSQVVARYVFNSGWGGALSFTRILFAWLILFGMAYGIKVGTHLGVDVFMRLLPRPMFKALAIFGALCGILYAVLLLHSDWLQLFGIDTRGGAIDYWSRMYKIGIGLEDLLYPQWVQDYLGTQARVQRWIAYIMLPIGLALLALRCLQALVDIVRGRRETIIASHEAEELVAENRGAAAGDDMGAQDMGAQDERPDR